MWVLIIIIFLCLLFANSSKPSARTYNDEHSLDDDVEDFLIMDYLSDEEINGALDLPIFTHCHQLLTAHLHNTSLVVLFCIGQP